MHKDKNRKKKLKTSRAELPLTTEIYAVRRRPAKICPKIPRSEKSGQEILVGTNCKFQAQSPSLSGLYNVIENRSLLKQNQRLRKTKRLVQKPTG